jgi:hypothetical protein
LIILLISLLSDGDVLTKDMLDPGRTNIESKTGESKGWLKQDTYIHRQKNKTPR